MLANQLICIAYFADYEKHSQLLQVNQEITQWLIKEFNTLQQLVESL